VTLRLRPLLAMVGIVAAVAAMLVVQPGDTTAQGPTVVRIDSNTPVPIPDLATVTSILSTPDNVKTLNVTKVTVSLHITHTFDGDLRVSLRNGQGTSVILANRVGGGGDNFGTSCADGSRTVFDQLAATPIASGSAPFVGVFRPSQSLDAFNNQFAAGSWTLTIQDLAAADIGTLHCWSLIIEFGAGPAPIPTVTPSPGPTVPPTPTPAPSIPGLAPMTVQGTAFIGANPAPAGTSIQAFIGATLCSAATTVGGGGSFSISVRSVSQQAGCGLAGQTVSFRLGGQAAFNNPPVNFQPGGFQGGVQVVRP